MASRTILLAGRGVTIADVVTVARDRAAVAIDDAARERLVAARAVVDRLAQSDAAIYGLTTALGANTGSRIAPEEQIAYQERAVLARAVSVGPRFAADTVRAMMFTRAAGMAVGGSGVSPAVLDALVAMLNAGVHPVVPSIGSIGAADLAPLAHLALPLIGHGEAEYGGETMTGANALAKAGLKPAALTGKDGLALISSNAATVGHAALVLHDAHQVLDAMNIATSLSHEAFRAHLSPLDPRAQAARPAPGQNAVAARLTALLEGSALWQPGNSRRVQDPLSFRCVTQVHGAALDAAWHAGEHVEIELNSAAESPLVIVHAGEGSARASGESGDKTNNQAGGEMLSNGNFHAPGLAIAFDTLGLAMSHVAVMCAERCIKLLAHRFSSLPMQLTRHGPAHSGFATTQKTLTALCNRIRHAANPASLDSLPVSEGVEDHAPMTANVVAKTATIVDDLRYLAAIELIIAAQALDLSGVDLATVGQGVRTAHGAVRAGVPMLDGDRPLGPDIETVERALRAGRFAVEPQWRGAR